jgi:hypothetical protein
MNLNFLKLVLIISTCSLMAFTSSCKKEEEESGGGGGGGNSGKGCIQGVVMNGLTGDRVKLPSFDVGVGIFVLVKNKLIPGKPLTINEEDPDFKQGEYSLCGIPLDETFPLFLWLPDHEPFEAQITVASTVAAKSSQAQFDILRKKPTDIANLLAFPRGTPVKDLIFTVHKSGGFVEGAQVFLSPDGTNFINWGSGYLGATPLRSKPLTGTSSAEGVVTFAAADLVLGAKYTWIVLPPDGGVDTTANSSAGSFTVGLRASGDTDEPYEINVDLDHTQPAVAELSRTTDNNDPISSGAITIFYNRAIELVPGTLDGITATLTGAVTAVLADNTAANDATEQVKVAIEGNKLTLTPLWKTDPDSDVSKEYGLAITYNGIMVRPTESPEILGSSTLTGATVNFYQ